MNIYSVFVIITSDVDLQKNYILSGSDSSILLPVHRIENAKFLHNEIRYHFKSLFDHHDATIIENIHLSYLDIQNDLAQNYIDSINVNEFYKNDDLFLLTGVILDHKYESKYFWKQFEFRKNNAILDNLIDYTIQKTVI